MAIEWKDEAQEPIVRRCVQRAQLTSRSLLRLESVGAERRHWSLITTRLIDRWLDEGAAREIAMREALEEAEQVVAALRKELGAQ